MPSTDPSRTCPEQVPCRDQLVLHSSVLLAAVRTSDTVSHLPSLVQNQKSNCDHPDPPSPIDCQESQEPDRERRIGLLHHKWKATYTVPGERNGRVHVDHQRRGGTLVHIDHPHVTSRESTSDKARASATSPSPSSTKAIIRGLPSLPPSVGFSPAPLDSLGFERLVSLVALHQDLVSSSTRILNLPSPWVCLDILSNIPCLDLSSTTQPLT